MKGFTIIELIMVVAIVTLVAASSTPFLSSFILRNNWETGIDNVVAATRKAQIYAMSGKGSGPWGVCITGTTYRMFNGSCASPTQKDDYAFHAGVSASGITSITFDSKTGTPSAVSTITITSSIGTKNVSINAAGMIQEN